MAYQLPSMALEALFAQSLASTYPARTNNQSQNSGFYSDQVSFSQAGTMNRGYTSSDLKLFIVLSSLSVCTVLVTVLEPVVQPRLPKWLKPFAQEEHVRPKNQRRWSHWTIWLALTSMAGLALSIVPIVLAPKHWLTVLELVPWLSASLITAFKRPTKTPRILLAQYFIIFTSYLLFFAAMYLNGHITDQHPFRYGMTAASAIGILLIGNMPIRDPTWDVSDIGSTKLPPSSEVRSPEDNLTLFQFWTMSWAYPLAKVCMKREIDVEDVWQLPYEFQHSRLYMVFRDLHGKLLICLIRANGLDLTIAVTLGVVEKVAEVSNIRLTSQLYRALDKGDPEEAIFWCLFMFCLDFFRQLASTTSQWYGRKSLRAISGRDFYRTFQ